ncbi:MULTISPECIES: amino acid ABC transporter ATP-binding/permease protein [unclassified Acinetobacter]|uniref:amino acid ABC transporter ATP-binding/permease protein n=1 Tax=unclassified Acinetobacter TaxID=196816 RepID=UPI0035B9E0E2
MKNNQKKSANHHTFQLGELISTQLELWIFSWLLAVVTAIAVVGLLMLSGWFISASALAGLIALGSHNFNYLMPSAIIRSFAMARTAGRYGELMVSHHAIFALLKQLRVKFFQKFAQLPSLQRNQQLRSSHIMHRLTHDIDTLDEFVLRVVSPWLVVSLILLGFGVLSYFILQSFGLAWGGFVCLWLAVILGMSVLIPLFLQQKGMQQAEQQQQLAEQRRIALLEPLTALTHLLIWQSWHREVQDFWQKEQQHIAQQQQIQQQRGIASLVLQWVWALAIVAVLWAVVSFSQGQFYSTVSVPLLLAVVLGILALAEIVLPLVQHYLALGHSISARNRLNQILENASVIDAEQPIQEIDIKGNIILDVQGLTAKMPNALNGVDNLNFSAHKGQVVLITGRSGAGKSTLLNALAGEITAQSGQILLNQQALNQHNSSQNNVMQNAEYIAYLAQQIDIFDQSLANNLRLAKPTASDAELWQVLASVDLEDWAKAQPLQLDTPLGEYGLAVSGGQARRIALARLLLKNKPILLLDEPFAGLDTDTRQRLWQNLIAHQKHGILILVSHHFWQDMYQNADAVHIQIGN